MSSRLGFLILGLSGLAAGCASDDDAQRDVDDVVVPSVSDPTPRRAELGITAARERWDLRRPAAYTFGWQQHCFCTQDDVRPLQVSVVANDVVRASYASDDMPVAAERVQYLSTIDDVFDRLDRAIEEKAFLIRVTFDADFGYPTSVAVDYDEWTADDELALELGSLQTDSL
ncbi:MAG: hypothetical protein H7138_19590 [Myxococcales bacterium]|nr:hypothetical protein [Myxococcales bacterium]